MKRWEWALLASLFVLVLGLRLFFAFTTPHFSPDAYIHVRFVEHIMERGTLLSYDPLSYGGRTFLVSPFFYYLLGALSFIFSLDFSLRFFPQLFLSSLLIIVFFIVRDITKKPLAAFFSAFLSAFIPTLFSQTIFSLSPLTLALPLLFLSLFVFFYVSRARLVVPFVLLVAVLSFVHPTSIFLVVGFIGYIILSKFEHIQLDRAESELVFFSTFVFLWVQFLIYKQALLFHGLSFITQNIPLDIISGYFVDVSLLSALLQLGIIPLIAGVYCVYISLLKSKDKQLLLYIAFGILVSLFVVFRFIEPFVGFMYLGVCLSILSGPIFASFMGYMKKTRFPHAHIISGITLLIIFFVSMVIPSIHFARAQQDATISDDLYSALIWIRNNTPSDSTVLAPLEEGHLITSIARRKNVIDNSFVLTSDSDKRLHDVKQMFTAPFPTEAVELLVHYKVGYIIFSRLARIRFSISDLPYHDQFCIHPVYTHNNTIVYRSTCGLEVSER